MTRHPPDPSCDCDLCFADQLERVAAAYRLIREGSPLATLPGWDRAERLASERKSDIVD